MKSLVVLLLFVPILFALPPEIEEYRADLIQNHPLLQTVDENLKKNIYEQELATRQPDPMIGATVALSPVETRVGPQRGAISLSQKLLFPSLLKARKKTKKLGEPLLETTKELHKTNLMAELLTYVIHLQELEKRLKLYEEYNRLIKTRLEVVESRYIATSTARRAVISAELELVRNEDKIKKLLKKQRDIEIAFNSLMGYSPETPVHLPDSLLYLLLREERTLDESNPGLKILHKKIALSNQKSKLEKELLFPGITVGGKYIVNGESEMMPTPEKSGKDAFQLFIKAPIPLSKKKNTLRVSVIKQEELRLHAEKDAFLRKLNKKMETLFATLKEEERKIVLSTKTIIPKLQELQENSMELYSTGKLRFDELLLTERELVMEENILLTAQVTRIKTIIEINNLLGETYEASK